jgi:hypothetical protein
VEGDDTIIIVDGLYGEREGEKHEVRWQVRNSSVSNLRQNVNKLTIIHTNAILQLTSSTTSLLGLFLRSRMAVEKSFLALHEREEERGRGR